MKKIALLAVLAVVALVGGGQAAGASTKSNKCQPHKVSYDVHGKLVSGSLTKNSDKTWSGTLTVHVNRTNKHAKDQKGTDQTYTLDHVKGKVGKGEDPNALTPDSRVEVKGKITKLAKKCDQTGFTPTVTVKHFTVKLPKKPKS